MAEFQKYRALTRIHLPPPNEGHLETKEVVSFDGTTLLRDDGTKIELPFPTAIRGAIKAGWLVPIDSDVTQYTPKSAGVEVRAAQSTGEKRERINVMTVQDEERDLGSRMAIRKGADQNSAKRVSQGARTGVVVQRDDSGGVVVGRFKTSAKSEPVQVGRDDHKVRNAADMKSKVEVERMGKPVRSATFTGDVQEARSGDTLTDLLPDAESSGRPEGTFVNDGVAVSSAGSSVGGSDDGVIIGSVDRKAAAAPVDKNTEALENALRSWADTGTTWNGKPVDLADMSVMVKATLRSLDAARSNVAAAPPEAAPEAPTEEASEFSWDVSTHWKTRVALALGTYGDDPEALKAILELEPSAGVKKAIKARLEELAA